METHHPYSSAREDVWADSPEVAAAPDERSTDACSISYAHPGA